MAASIEWAIVIRGRGVHHTPKIQAAVAADALARALVRELLAAGHELAEATFQAGDRESLLPSTEPLPAFTECPFCHQRTVHPSTVRCTACGRRADEGGKIG